MDVKKSFLLCVLLAIAGIAVAEDVHRVKREDIPEGGEPNNLANQIRRKTGFDTQDLPEDLMQTAADLFSMAKSTDTNSTMMMILKMVQEKMKGNMPMDEVKRDFNGILTNAEFIKAFKDLKGKHKDNLDGEEFKMAAKDMIAEYMAASSAVGLTASLAAVFMAVFVHFVHFL